VELAWKLLPAAKEAVYAPFGYDFSISADVWGASGWTMPSTASVVFADATMSVSDDGTTNLL
jgi:hypothetical protein